jgi:hypothetical protein
MHAGVAQDAVTGEARVYADAEAAPSRLAPADVMTWYHSIYTGSERQQAWPPPDPIERGE